MHDILAVHVDERLDNLLGVHPGVLLANAPVLRTHLGNALVNVFEVDAQDIILNNLGIEVLDNMPVLKLLVNIDLLFDGLHLLFIQAQVRVHQFDILYSKCLSCFDI